MNPPPTIDTPQALILGLVQGLTEFLPISSTAHLRIVPYYLGWPDPGTAFSAVIQLGTLTAVLAFFAGDIRLLGSAAIDSLKNRNFNHSPESRLAWSIVPATLPIAILGIGFKHWIETEARSLNIIATTLIALALLLMVAERVGNRQCAMRNLGFWPTQIIGLCQALALIPGCSRSGSTIMGGLLVGLRRQDAARFSFLLGLPAIGASGVLELFELLEAGIGGTGLLAIVAGATAAAFSGYMSIGFLLRFLNRHGTDIFSVYRILLGLSVLYTLN